jgi:hypothetical protein
MSEIKTLFGLEKQKEEPEEVKSSFNVWDFITDISKTKKYLFEESTQRLYEPWIVNKAFMAHTDTFIYAEAVNRMHHIDKKMQHDYMFYSVPAHSKRYKPWLKKTEADKREANMYHDIGTIINLNLDRTKKFWKLLTPEQRADFLSRYVYPDSNNTVKIKKK